MKIKKEILIEVIRQIVHENPLTMEYEADARYVWPKRWDELEIFIESQVEN